MSSPEILASKDGRRRIVALLDAEDASRRELHLLIKAMGYEVRAHSSADALATDQLAIQARWLIINRRDDSATVAVLRALRTSGWRGKVAVIAGEQTDGFQQLATPDYDVAFLAHPATTHNLSRILTSPTESRHDS